jgi:hypothetical protein
MLRYRLHIAALGVLCSGFSLGLPVSANDGGFHLVTESQGDVKSQRKGQKVQPVHVGDRLRTTDKLLLGKGGRAKVLCQNLATWSPNKAGSFEIATGCKVSGRSVLQSVNSDRIPTRSSNDPKIPYIISPRNTKIIESEPLLKWNPVAGAKSYRVSVTGPDVNWDTTVTQSQVVYGGTDPLKPRIRYRVMVTAESGESSNSDVVTGFERLDDVAVTQLKSDIAAVLEQKDLSEEATVLAITHLERSNELYGSAIDRLEQWLNQGNQSAAIYQLLGDLYLQVELPRLARKPYIEGLKLMRQSKKMTDEATTLSNLGEIDELLGELREAIFWLKSAKNIYQQLADEERVQTTEIKLSDLQRRI